MNGSWCLGYYEEGRAFPLERAGKGRREGRKETAGDENASAMVEYFASIPGVSVPMNREAPSVRAG